MFPKINKQPTKTVTAPELSGGINLRDSVTMIQDNQLTDGVNVWFKDSVLKSRPGMQALTCKHLLWDRKHNWSVDSAIKSRSTNIQREINGKTYRLFTTLVKAGNDDNIFFRLVSGNDVIDLPSIHSCYYQESFITNYVVIEHGQTIYCLNATSMYITDCPVGWKLENGSGSWEELFKEDCYAPILLTNCVTNITYGYEGVLYEAANLFGNRYRMIYSTVNIEIASHEGAWHTMRYTLEYSVDDCNPGEKVFATITDKDGKKWKHTVFLSGQGMVTEEIEPGDGLYMQVYGKTLRFKKKDDNGDLVDVTLTKDDYIMNNLEINAPYKRENDESKKVLGMTNSIWFGGGSEGINGGSRIFLCGNIEEKEKNLVVWSDLNKPLYFPENNYFYVGDSSQAVTGFSTHDETLVIFKEREIYYTYYKQGADYDASDIISQSAVGVTPASAYFPLVQIHGSIGCDCPNSIQFCRNQPVWANKNGKVYTLVSNNQYSERNVFEVSGMIEPRLKQETPTDLANALSCDWQGMYCLFVGNNMYLMDYNSYGYQYAYSYSTIESGNNKIPWWYWEFPDFSNGKENIYNQFYAVYAVENSMAIGAVRVVQTETKEGEEVWFYYEDVYVISPELKEDKGYLLKLENIPESYDQPPEIPGVTIMPINVAAQTKIFDFGVPNRNKAINLVNISFGNNGGEPISLKYITENGECQDEAIRLRMDDTTEYSAGYVRNKPFRPCVGLVNRFGLRLECEGDMAVDAISIDYRLTGVAK